MNLLRSLARFTKLEHTVFSLPIVFAGAWLGAGRHMPGAGKLVLIVLAATGGRTLGMAMNRILDREIDALNARTRGRELPSGLLSLRKAWLIAAIGLAVYLVACALLGPLILALSPVPAVFLIGYTLLKRFTCLCHYGIGLVLGMAPLAAYVAVQGRIAVTPDILLLSGFVLFWISGYDIIYALQDQEFDRQYGVHSIPGRFGSAVAQGVALASHAVAWLLLAAFAAGCAEGRLAWVPVACCGVTLGLSYMPWIPLPVRFFPLSAIASITGSLVVYF